MSRLRRIGSFLSRSAFFTIAGVVLLLLIALSNQAKADGLNSSATQHVLVLSVDGMHAIDLARYVQANPASSFAALVQNGVNYTTASCARPADSFPGMMAIATGGSPVSTGVYFDLSYDRSLWPPTITSGPTGTIVVFNETVDLNANVLDGGGGLNENLLPRDPARGGAIVYPHNYLRVNTIFEVIKAAGGRTAWSDKHIADEMIQGPSGNGVDDLYLLEINASNIYGVSTTKSLDLTKSFDDMKVEGILNQINGLDYTGSASNGVPTIFGMNFQAVSVAQRLKTNKTITGSTATGTNAGPGGYLDGTATPSALLVDALNHTDYSIGLMMEALQGNGLLDSTVIILTAKHGQGPIDPTKLATVDPTNIIGRIDPAITHVLLLSGDNVPLVWLQDQSKTAAAINALLPYQTSLNVQDFWAGEILKLHFPDPLIDSRTPDFFALTKPGTIYTTSKSKIAEHGGFSDQDLNVPIVIFNPQLSPETITTPVQTTQIAPTILTLFGLNPLSLQAVQIEKTKVLPDFDPAQLNVPPAPVQFSSTVQLTDGKSQFQLSAGAVQNVDVQASTDLTNWLSIGTTKIAVGGSAMVTDPDAASFTNRFYRAQLVP